MGWVGREVSLASEPLSPHQLSLLRAVPRLRSRPVSPARDGGLASLVEGRRDGETTRGVRSVAGRPWPRSGSSAVPTGRVLVELRKAWRDGTTHVLFEPPEFLAELAA